MYCICLNKLLMRNNLVAILLTHLGAGKYFSPHPTIIWIVYMLGKDVINVADKHESVRVDTAKPKASNRFW